MATADTHTALALTSHGPTKTPSAGLEAGAQRDVYANLLRETRGLAPAQEAARAQWYAALAWEHKEETLFELEMLLKGLVCFGHWRNYEEGNGHSAPMARDYSRHARVVHATLTRILALLKALLGASERRYTFARYLEGMLPEDIERQRLVQAQLRQDSPIDALLVLRTSLDALTDIAAGLCQQTHVTHRPFDALLRLCAREISRNLYFNPLVALEFRPEFDRIRNPQILEALHAIDSRAAHQIAALTFLSAHRCLRYLALIEDELRQQVGVWRTHIMLALTRSDVRALCRFLRQRAPHVLASGFEREILAVPASELTQRFDTLRHTASRLTALRHSAQQVATTLQAAVESVIAETGKQLHDTDAHGPEAGRLQLGQARHSLEAAIHHAVEGLFLELSPDESLAPLRPDARRRRLASARLRRDVWIFAKVLQAFVVKAGACLHQEEHWSQLRDFDFVHDFLRHFRAIGYQLVRSSDYAGLDRFLGAVEVLRTHNLLDPPHLEEAREQCDALRTHLETLFVQVDQREELRDWPFDKHRAASSLRTYLAQKSDALTPVMST